MAAPAGECFPLWRSAEDLRPFVHQHSVSPTDGGPSHAPAAVCLCARFLMGVLGDDLPALRFAELASVG
jgi:hypothetical protein